MAETAQGTEPEESSATDAETDAEAEPSVAADRIQEAIEYLQEQDALGEPTREDDGLTLRVPVDEEGDPRDANAPIQYAMVILGLDTEDVPTRQQADPGAVEEPFYDFFTQDAEGLYAAFDLS